MASPDLLNDMNERSREIFRRLVEGYLESGGPVGSRTLTRTLNEKVSAATVRNVMQDLEFLGLDHSSGIKAQTLSGLHEKRDHQKRTSGKPKKQGERGATGSTKESAKRHANRKGG